MVIRHKLVDAQGLPARYQLKSFSDSPTVQALAFVYIMISKYDRHKKTIISA
jgi:hypothetical protein